MLIEQHCEDYLIIDVDEDADLILSDLHAEAVFAAFFRGAHHEDLVVLGDEPARSVLLSGHDEAVPLALMYGHVVLVLAAGVVERLLIVQPCPEVLKVDRLEHFDLFPHFDHLRRDFRLRDHQHVDLLTQASDLFKLFLLRRVGLLPQQPVLP